MEHFCAAKPYSRDLKTVRRTKCAVLERFVSYFFRTKHYLKTLSFHILAFGLVTPRKIIVQGFMVCALPKGLASCELDMNANESDKIILLFQFQWSKSLHHAIQIN
jgi:hypothetical protein